MKVKSILILAILTLVLSSCGSKKRVVSTTKPKKVVEKPTEEDVVIDKNQNDNIVTYTDLHLKKLTETKPNLNKYTLQYVRKFANIAVSEMHQNKIPASITLAQGVLESGNGRSELALKSNNHFGIKCHRGWQGKSVTHDDDARGECFRKYKHPETSYVDHSIFLRSRKRYAKLFDLSMSDYRGWARGLRKAGYATDKRYPQKIIRIIEDYQLYAFDHVLSDGTKTEYVPAKIEHENQENSNTSVAEATASYYVVQKGDTLYAIAKKHRVSVEDLKRLNNLKDFTISIGQELRIQ